MKMLLQWERSSETIGSRFLQVFTTVFMSCRLVLRPRLAGWSPVLIWAASWSSMICWAACGRHLSFNLLHLLHLVHNLWSYIFRVLSLSITDALGIVHWLKLKYIKYRECINWYESLEKPHLKRNFDILGRRVEYDTRWSPRKLVCTGMVDLKKICNSHTQKKKTRKKTRTIKAKEKDY